MRDFLNYLISQTLADGPARLKEFAIGVAVFGKDETFDPKIDAVVRVEASRLRSKLRDYYASAGRDDNLLISIPKGAYVPQFEIIDADLTTKSADATFVALSARGHRLLYLLGLCVVAAAAIWTYGKWPQESDVGDIVAPPYSIAVLPLRDWNGDSADYFSEAMTDVLITKLSERRTLRVTSLGSVMNYRQSEFAVADIARKLGVEYVVEGTVYRDSGEVRITANLINANENRNTWSQSYNRPLESVLSLQDEVANAIATQLVGELVPADATIDRNINPMAYEAFLKGAYWRNRLTDQGFNRGILFFQEAIELQPDYAEAYAAMAACHCRLAGHGIEVVPPNIALPQATQLATHALELDSKLAEASAVLGIINFKYNWDTAAAESFLSRALEQNPSLFEAHLWLSQVYEGTGRHELAVTQARIARSVNPLSPAAGLNLGWQLFQAGQSLPAEIEFDNLLEFDPDFWGGHWGKGHIYLQRDMHADAIAEFSRAVELGGGHTLPLASLGYAHALAGQRDEAFAVIKQLHEIAENIYVSPVDVATVYAGLNEREDVFEWLQKAYEVRARSIAWLSVKKEFTAVRDDPRFIALIASVGTTLGQSD